MHPQIPWQPAACYLTIGCFQVKVVEGPWTALVLKGVWRMESPSTRIEEMKGPSSVSYARWW